MKHRDSSSGGILHAAAAWAARLSGEGPRSSGDGAPAPAEEPSELVSPAPRHSASARSAQPRESGGTPWYMDPSVQEVTRRARPQPQPQPRREAEDWEAPDVDAWRRRAGRGIVTEARHSAPPARTAAHTSPPRKQAGSRRAAAAKKKSGGALEDLRYLLWSAAILVGLLGTVLTFLFTAIAS